MAGKNKLSIYLVKPGIERAEDILENFDELEILQEYNNGAKAYFEPSRVHTPEWLESFFHISVNKNLLQADSRVVLLFPICVLDTTRVFALTFGYAKHMIKENVLVEDFGQKIVLNSIEKNRLRRIAKYCLGSNKKLSNEQMPKNSEITEFGFDTNRDLMKNLTGKLNDTSSILGKGMVTGGDIFSLNIERDIDNVEELLLECFAKYSETTYVNNFSWIDNIKIIRDESLTYQLDLQLLGKLNKRDYDGVWVVVPEVLPEDDMWKFRVPGQKEFVEFVSMDYIVDSFKGQIDTVECLKKKTIIAVSETDENLVKRWSVFKCLCIEVVMDESVYSLYEGKWYSISENYYEKVNAEYNEISLFRESLPEYNHSDEGDYNQDACNSLEGAHLMHKVLTYLENGPFETCDILWNQKLIHIKRGHQANSVRCVSAQALVSGHALLDSGIRERIRKKAEEEGIRGVICEPFVSQDYEIVLAIVEKESSQERPKVTFFGKVTICSVAKELKSLGYSFSLKSIRDIR